METMVPVPALWLPILLAAVLVFVASSVIHMLLPYHRTDYQKLPREDDVMNALRPLGIPPGDYTVPHAPTMAAMKDPAFVDRVTKGPVAFMTVLPNGMPSMNKSLVLWFVYCVVMGVFAAYVSGRALPPGAGYLEVFRLAGSAAFLGYTAALWQQSIWFYRPWSATFKHSFDGLVYALLTAGAFGWLWPS